MILFETLKPKFTKPIGSLLFKLRIRISVFSVFSRSAALGTATQSPASPVSAWPAPLQCESSAVKRRRLKHLNPFRTLAVSACCVFFHQLFPAAIRVTRIWHMKWLCARVCVCVCVRLPCFNLCVHSAFAIQCAKDESCLIHPSCHGKKRESEKRKPISSRRP